MSQTAAVIPDFDNLGDLPDDEATYKPPFSTKFYDPEEFTFLHPLRDAWKEIYQEFLGLEEHSLHPWPESHLYQLNDFDNEKAELGKGWTVFGLYAFGKKREAGCELCPITTEIVESFPMPPKTVAFSHLLPNAHILPHSGYVGYSSKVLRAHLGLEVPKDCFPSGAVSRITKLNEKISSSDLNWFQKSVWNFEYADALEYSGCCLRVGDQASTWKPGEFMVFDDSHIHEAWNFTPERRVVLLMDFDRPKKYWPEWATIESAVQKANTNPFVNGNRGEMYLDKLTDQWGYAKK
jgi:aspartyl/asparaginyl beta-hydroxylase (cupin superfamily)